MFDKSDVTAALQPITPGAVMQVQLDGAFADGILLRGFDCLIYASAGYDDDDSSRGTGPRTARLGPAAPNPFNPVTRISYYVPNESLVQLSVFDLRGRLVRELVSGQMEAGSHEVMWNGRDSRGQMSATGVYFARLSSADGNKTVKMVLAK